ncbi:hypothetical protein KIP30_gp36 [Mycobacterium phage Pistachio]|uniref:Uncharacterized protein n=1 Tax=Mycobacterium phage Pistachio TaxID=2126722 RepID=A0A2R4A2A5_9CAUD|nr:hypothetical protein KIP30_gp36 [Mycobacterium phage Pistachio]AQT28459.1 hypothetical protein SEA_IDLEANDCOVERT_60 [Mycobacterium phage Idleandcovert]AVR57044.1 hypothetical protein PBI_PUPPY_61 [Mycobacterium phage Puppy]AVR77471.1 hypothetical protein SEA_TNGUYEN7_61 [Mycobacterium phage TNguyen7]WAB10247.1 hypothetical protein PBI_BLUEBIRD_62 [Mycobacterium phage BlueBird]AVR57133.1 hypothetical protein PBI_PISTACHIO_61 [Mycobacterium phage Pistachio]
MYYRIDAIIKSDRDEEELGMFIEGILEGHFKSNVKDLSVFEITHYER